MNQEVIQDFLNVPGITGIALLSRQSEPVFYSSHPESFQERLKFLSEGILQVVETIPTEYEVLEFQCAQTQVVLCRLLQNMILLALKDQSCITEQFTHVVEALRSHIVVEPIASESVDSLTDSSRPTRQDLLDAFNQLNQFTRQSLGVAVIVNYLKKTCPMRDGFEQFQVERSGQIRFVGESSTLEQAVSAQEYDWFRAWVAQFIRRCSQAVRNYAVLVEQHALTDTQKALLLP
ncbi:hypothetical protein H6F89_14755 [Cyanobacteria bacterium FACHB-63]|nr:hypothetical protein [Cyanobacteria bacterium FACHB-63]